MEHRYLARGAPRWHPLRLLAIDEQEVGAALDKEGVDLALEVGGEVAKMTMSSACLRWECQLSGTEAVRFRAEIRVR